MKRKKTKKALSGSVLALVLCFVMLIGTTFAWFTSSDSTAVNKIEAGTLEVDIVGENGNSLENDKLVWQKAAGHTSEAILWEPGVTYRTQSFKIANKGNLALKFNFSINGVDGSSKLLEAIDFKVVKAGETPAAVSLDTFVGHLAAGTANAPTTSDTYYIEGTMKTTAGNEYQNETLDGIGITVYATQDTVEYDSYGYEYDKDAELPDVDATPVASVNDLKNVKAGDSVVLTNNITTGNAADNYGDSTVGIKLAAGTTLDGNGNTLSKGGKDGYAILTAGSTIKNLTLNDSGRAIFIADATADTVIDNVVIDGAGYAINTGTNTNTTTKLTVTNSTINGWTSFANVASASFTNCSFGSSDYYEAEVYQHYLRPYVTATFTNCDFDEGFYIDLTKLGEGCNVTLDNCTCNGVKLTNENFADHIKIIKGVENGSDVYAANGDTISNVSFK